MVKKFGIAISFCLLLLNASVAQTEKSGSTKGVKEFAVADVSCESSRTCNSFLKVISQSSGFPIDRARYSIYYTFNFSINNREAEIEIVLDSIRGTTVYRGFDLSEKLIPSSVELAWAYFSPEGNKIPGGHKEVFRIGKNKYSLNTRIPEAIDVVEALPVDIQFIYRESDFEDFDAASRMIQRYYAASDICDTMLVHIGNIDPRDLSQSLPGYLKYYDFRRVEQVLQNEDFTVSLPLEELDPADYYGDMRRIGGRLFGLKMNLDDALRSWRGLIKKNTAIELANKLYSQSHFWYDLSGDVEYHYKEIFYDLGNVAGEFSLADSLVETFHPDDIRFLKEVCRYSAGKFLEEARYNIEVEDYTHAVSLGRNAKYYADKAEALQDDANEVLRVAWQGLYESYLLISRRTITIGNYEFAEQYLNEATELFNRSEGYLSDNDGVGDVFENLFNSVFSQAQTSMELGVPRDALYFFNEAARIDSAYLSATNAAMVKTNLDKLQHAVYFSYLDEISYFINSGDGFMARDYYEKAAGYRLENSITEESGLLDSLNTQIISLEFLDFIKSAGENWPENPKKAVSLLEQAAYFLNYAEIAKDSIWYDAVEKIVVSQMKKKLSHGRVLVWGAKFQEARQLITEMNRLSILFGLQEHPVNLLITDLNERMLKKQCTDLENNYRKNIFAVRSSIREGNFLEASDIISSLNLDEAENCGFDISEARSIETEYEYYFEYYLLIDTCRSHLIFSRAGKAVEFYLKAKTAAKQIQRVDKDFLEIKLTSLMEMYKREALSDEIALGFLGSDPLQAIDVLQFAAENDVSVSGKTMHKVGIAMGESDLRNENFKDGSFYTNGRKSLTPLKNAYNVKVRSKNNIVYRALLNLFFRHD